MLFPYRYLRLSTNEYIGIFDTIFFSNRLFLFDLSGRFKQVAGYGT